MVSALELTNAYQKTVAKLNKMFFRTENCKDAATQFRNLQRLFQREGELRYAAFCCLSVGRCEEAVRNTLGAASEYSFVGLFFTICAAMFFLLYLFCFALWKAVKTLTLPLFVCTGHTFLQIELQNMRDVFPNFRENVLEATQCFLLAVEVGTHRD
jgi:predicted TIM-barrel fold metal-dependent hydrolase